MANQGDVTRVTQANPGTQDVKAGSSGLMTQLPLIAGAALALVGFVLVNSATNERVARIKKKYERPMVGVLAAKRGLSRGDTVKSSDLGWKEVVKEEQPVGTIKFGNPDESSESRRKYEDQLAMLEGLKVRRDIGKGEILHETDFETELGETLGEIVREGYRAFAIDVSRNSLLGGLLQPNDRVDVLATYSSTAFVIGVNTQSTRGGGREETAVILENVPVVAVGGRLARASAAGRGTSGTVVLELTPDEALTLTHVQNRARLSLLLRSPADATSKYQKPRVDSADVGAVLERGFVPQK